MSSRPFDIMVFDDAVFDCLSDPTGKRWRDYGGTTRRTRSVERASSGRSTDRAPRFS